MFNLMISRKARMSKALPESLLFKNNFNESKNHSNFMVIGDNSMHPEFNMGDIVSYGAKSYMTDGIHILEDYYGNRKIRRVQFFSKGLIKVSSCDGSSYFFNESLPPKGLVSIGMVNDHWRKTKNTF